MQICSEVQQYAKLDSSGNGGFQLFEQRLEIFLKTFLICVCFSSTREVMLLDLIYGKDKAN